MGGTIFITARSIMSKIVGPDELGLNYNNIVSGLFAFIYLNDYCFRTSNCYLWYRRVASSNCIWSNVQCDI